MLLLSERFTLFENLHNEWFSNERFWFDKKPENDHYLSDKYFEHIKFAFDCDIENLKKQNMNVKIGAIIAYDQLPRHFNRIYNITSIEYSNVYSKIAADISLSIMAEVYGKTNLYDNISIAEWCFIFMPFRHLKEVSKIEKCIDFMLSKYNNVYISMDEKNMCSNFVLNSIKDIHGSNTTDIVSAYNRHFERHINVKNQWNILEDIFLKST